MVAPPTDEIVIVGDVVEDGTSRATVFDWDNPTWGEVDQLVEWLAVCGKRTEIVPSVRQFVSTASRYRGKVVFPLWRGGQSRSRTCLVPAVCEALSMSYVGADAFAQSVCQDKSLSKPLLEEAGFDCAPDTVIYALPLNKIEHDAIQNLQFPVVVKPLYSACSIGVEESSLCDDPVAALVRIAELLDQSLGPVIVEPFLRGEEISLCLVENDGEIELRCVAVYRDKRGECPFTGRLLTMTEKIMANRTWKVDFRQDDIGDGPWASAQKLIRRLGPLGPLRVDGRLSGSRFTAIEITPDIHLGLDSPFLGAFQAAGLAPPAVLDAMIRSAAVTRVGAEASDRVVGTTGGRHAGNVTGQD